MKIYLATIIQMGHDVKDTLKSYWSTAEQFFVLFCTNTIKNKHFPSHIEIPTT